MPRVPLVFLGAIAAACGTGESAQDEIATPAVQITAPADDARVASGTVEITMTVSEIELRPAGTESPNSGHHHMFINRDIVAEGQVIPAEEGIVHLGAAQTSHVLDGLAPGTYTVIAVLGDFAHVRIPGARTDTIRFTIEAP